MTGQELKLKLIEAGKSQKDIAELLGVTAQSLSSVLSAKDDNCLSMFVSFSLLLFMNISLLKLIS